MAWLRERLLGKREAVRVVRLRKPSRYDAVLVEGMTWFDRLFGVSDPEEALPEDRQRAEP